MPRSQGRQISRSCAERKGRSNPDRRCRPVDSQPVAGHRHSVSGGVFEALIAYLELAYGRGGALRFIPRPLTAIKACQAARAERRMISGGFALMSLAPVHA